MATRFFLNTLILLALAAPGIAEEAETRCDPALPFSVALVPLDRPEAGRNVRLQLRIDSSLDPDRIRSARIEYEIPARFRNPGTLIEDPRIPLRRGTTRAQFALRVPDEARHELRARLVISLEGGREISQTASCWIDAGEPDPPAGMIGRVPDRDGAGVRIYQGVTARGRP